jgi:hypothetical protein
VFPPLGLTDYKNVLETHLFFVRRWWERGIHGRLILRGRQNRQEQKED